MKQPIVYLLANKKNGTLYTGVTTDLIKRIWEHRNHITGGFASRYGAHLLVWYEIHETVEGAILREKQIKGGSRAAKVRLIMAINPDWRDLYEDLL